MDIEKDQVIWTLDGWMVNYPALGKDLGRTELVPPQEAGKEGKGILGGLQESREVC